MTATQNPSQTNLKPLYAMNQREIYLRALERAAKPAPSIMMPDWPLWNSLTGGFRSREFSILCGATGVGKTTLLANISAQLLKTGEKHFVMSVETGAEDYMLRVMSSLAGEDLNTGDVVSSEKLAGIHTRHSKLLESDTIEFSLYEDRLSVEQLKADVRQMAGKGCRIVFIDNLNFLLEPTSSQNQVIEMDRVIHSLVVFCKQTDVHLVMVMHPKKTEHGRVESEFDIKGSSTAVQEAQNIFLFNRPRPALLQDGSAKLDWRELTLQKMRRRGRHVGKTLLFSPLGGGTSYVEEKFAAPAWVRR